MIPSIQIIKAHIENAYGLCVMDIALERDIIGSVFFVRCKDQDLIFKLYQEDTSIDIDETIKVLTYLSENAFNVPKIIKSKHLESYTSLQKRKGILFEYVDGSAVSIQDDQEEIIKLFRQLNDCMRNYPNPISKRSYSYYVSRFINLLKHVDFPMKKVDEIESSTRKMYTSMKSLKRGFCHGDFHTGNMIKKNNEIYLLDFDACHIESSYLDLLTVFDQTDFNRYNQKDLLKTYDYLKSIDDLKSVDVMSLLAFIPIRHCEIIANIIQAGNEKVIEDSFAEEQYQWIMAFYRDWLSLIKSNSTGKEK